MSYEYCYKQGEIIDDSCHEDSYFSLERKNGKTKLKITIDVDDVEDILFDDLVYALRNKKENIKKLVRNYLQVQKR